MRRSDVIRILITALTAITVVVVNVWVNLLSIEIQQLQLVLNGLHLVTIALVLIGLISLLSTKRVRQFIAGFFVKEDLERMAGVLDRHSKLLRVFDSLDTQIAELATAKGNGKTTKRNALLVSIAEAAGAVMPREPGDDRRCIILVPKPATIGAPTELEAISWNVETNPQFAKSILLDISKTIAGKVFNSGRSHYSPDVSIDPDYVIHPTSPYAGRYQTLLATPVKNPIKPAHTLGVICLDNTRKNAYSEDDHARMAWIADKVGLVLYLGK